MFFVASLSTMNQGHRAGLNHLNLHQHMFNVAFSGYSSVLSKIHAKAWNDRIFKTSPYIQNSVALADAIYDLYVTNTPGKEYQLDLYVRVVFQKTTQVFFWRLLYVDDILDTTGRLYPLVFLDVEAKYFPGGGSSLDAFMNDILQKRRLNLAQSISVAKTLGTLNKVNDVATVLVAKPSGTTIPEPGFGTQNPNTPEFPAPFDTIEEIKNILGKPVPDAPSKPPQYEGPVGITNAGNSIRVATQDGQGQINAACINESGTRISVSIAGRSILNWRSSSKHSWPVIEQMRENRRKEMSDEEKEKEKSEWNKGKKQGFNLSFPVQAGQKVSVSFVGRKKCTKYSNWCQVTGPF